MNIVHSARVDDPSAGELLGVKGIRVVPPNLVKQPWEVVDKVPPIVYKLEGVCEVVPTPLGFG